jgi:hypothetical protein
MDCHEDYHEGQFVQIAGGPDCASCHTVDGFAGSSFTIERHDQSAFPLTGAHVATPCFACHLEETKWDFRDIGSACNDCHTNVHEGVLAEQFYPGRECRQCHSTERWSVVAFDHNQTDFPLSGKHATINCVACHKQDEQAAVPDKSVLTELETMCTSCHEDVHEGQFEMSGSADCRRCHDFAAWQPSQFDHNTARFKLDGAHLRVDCNKCHISEERDGRPLVIYKLNKLECMDCHM